MLEPVYIVAYDYHTYYEPTVGYSNDEQPVATYYLMDKGHRTANRLLAKPRETLGNAKRSVVHLKHYPRSDPGEWVHPTNWQQPATPYHKNYQRAWIENVRIIKVTDNKLEDEVVV